MTLSYHEGMSYRLYTLADAHIGNANAQRDKVEARVKEVENDPMGLLSVNGDMGDYITYTDKRFDPATLDEGLFTGLSDLNRLPEVYTEYLTELLMPVREKIICITSGGHEGHIAKLHQKDPLFSVAENLSLVSEDQNRNRWGQWACISTLKFEDGQKHADSFNVYQSHGWQTGRKSGALVNGLDDMMGWVECDLLLQGHSHHYLVKHKVVLYSDNGTIKQRTMVGAHTGGWLLTYKQVKDADRHSPSYAEKGTYAPTVIGSPTFRITPTRYGHGTVEG